MNNRLTKLIYSEFWCCKEFLNIASYITWNDQFINPLLTFLINSVVFFIRIIHYSTSLHFQLTYKKRMIFKKQISNVIIFKIQNKICTHFNEI